MYSKKFVFLVMLGSENDDDEDDDDTFEKKYLAVAMELDPGHFECPCVWRTQFYLHPGLKRLIRGGSSMSIGKDSLLLLWICFIHLIVLYPNLNL